MILHATTLRVAGQGVCIRGPSGSGKSGLAVQLMAFGAELVADDQTELSAQSGRLVASAPHALPALIEARGIGLITADLSGPVEVSLVVDMSDVEEKRLPAEHHIDLCGVTLPCLYRVDAPHFAASVVLLCRFGRLNPDA